MNITTDIDRLKIQDEKDNDKMNDVQTSLNEEGSIGNRIIKEDSTNWQKALENAIPAIVVIRVNAVRSFDGSGAGYSTATGFVVDKENGIILTNRHVVTPGPVIADAVFVNKEEVSLRPLYRDPVHDFGFFRFNPSSVKFMDLKEIKLAPYEAKVGIEIRVVGNDAGEKISILPGILAKLDRDAPEYGSSEYNDFNTFYYAAASSTSGGSSGSPVLNALGHAIALNAGGSKQAASSFYLPLDRAVRAMSKIQADESISRGTLQTIWRHSAFDEVRRLGLTTETEKLVRKELPHETGMLRVDQVVPGGPADSLLQPGDVLIRFDGKLRTTFIPIEEYLDEHVGRKVEIVVQRGGDTMSFNLIIQDLHSISPSMFLEVSGCILHSLSYQQARNASIKVGGVYTAQAGHMLLKSGMNHYCIIVAIGNTPTLTLDDFIREFETLPNGTRTTLRYFVLKDRHRLRTSVITVDRQWFPMAVYQRNDEDGLWYSTPCRNPPPLPASKAPEYSPTPLNLHRGDDLAKEVVNSLVMVSFDIPYMIDGISSSSYTGTGYVIDVDKGLIIVDKNTVPLALGDVLITVAASLEIPGEVVLVHPIHNYSIIKYNPQHLVGTNLKAIEFSTVDLMVGDTPDFIGLTSNFNVIYQKPTVAKIDRLVFRECNPPRYSANNVEVIHFDRVTKSVGGVFVDSLGCVSALWLSFCFQDENGLKEVFRGLPIHIFKDLVEDLRHGRNPVIRYLPIQIMTYPLSTARSGHRLPDKWIKKLEESQKDKRQVLVIKRTAADTNASVQLKHGDMLLEIDGRIISRDLDLELGCKDKTSVTLQIFRDFEEVKVNVEPAILSSIGTERVVMWSGMVIQSPHYEVISLGYIPEEGGGVYCSRWCYGSPAHKYGLRATVWIIEVNGVATPDLDTFLQVVKKMSTEEFVRLKTKDLHTKEKVFTLKTDYHYWPTRELKRINGEWKFS